MTTPQKEFTVGLPTQDNATPPDNLTVGQLTALDFVIGGTTYNFPLAATLPVGSTVTVLFSALTPPFVPVAGTSYSADCFVVDANGDSALSNTATWIQAAPVPLPPTNLSVA
jgi:hypothetical protein